VAGPRHHAGRRRRAPLGQPARRGHRRRRRVALRGDRAALPLLHVDLAGAVALTDTVGLTAGFATTSYALVEPRDETFVHTLALGGRYRDRHVTVDLALEVPVDARDRAVDTLMATAAVAWRL
jgi:hypothetical protein